MTKLRAVELSQLARIEYANARARVFFGRLKDIVGRSEEDAELSEGARVEDLFARYGRSFPRAWPNFVLRWWLR